MGSTAPEPWAELMLMFTPAAAAPPGSAVVALAALVPAKLPVFAKLTLCATRKKPLPVCGQCGHSVWCAGRMVHDRKDGMV